MVTLAGLKVSLNHFLSCQRRLEFGNVYLQSGIETLTFFGSRSAVAGVGAESRHAAGELRGKAHMLVTALKPASSEVIWETFGC